MSEGPPVVVAPKVIADDLPDDPLPWQKRAPCGGGLVEINGGCWLLLKMRPPCDEDAYEWKGACYLPILSRAKPRAAEKR
jgi:hypothetical protein